MMIRLAIWIFICIFTSTALLACYQRGSARKSRFIKTGIIIASISAFLLVFGPFLDFLEYRDGLDLIKQTFQGKSCGNIKVIESARHHTSSFTSGGHTYINYIIDVCGEQHDFDYSVLHQKLSQNK